MTIDKICKGCKLTKPITDFNKDKGRSDGLCYICRECVNAKTRKWYADNREKAVASSARWYLENREKAAKANKRWHDANPDRVTHMHREGNYLRKYGITYSKFLSLIEEQDGKCKVCFSELALTKGMSSYKAVLDHCHHTGVVRGVLCNNCNSGLGMFKDDPERLRLAAQYIETFYKPEEYEDR